ncbi:MAG: hypothetical protein JOZ77_05265 [Candidatus Eremiobacteraeota bacterium]|nr:hypothetical protein [Candidatus Eremiobacteraeota bacterium]
MTKSISAIALIVVLCGAPARAADSLASLSYLVGTWSCTYNAAGRHIAYTATYDYVAGNNWLRERNASSAGFSDVGLTTYEPKSNAWTEIVAGSDRSTTLFRAKGSDSAHRLYRSILPNALMMLRFDRVSNSKYTLHFSGTYAGKRMTSYDVCTKR